MDDVGAVDVAEPIEEVSAEDTASEIAPVETVEPEQPAEKPEPTAEDQSLGLKEVKNALARLRETNPKEADLLRKAYFSYNDLVKHFPTAREAQAARIALDTVGGVDGIATLREQVQASEYLEQAAEAGDSSIVDDWARDYPQGFQQVMPYAMRQFAKMDPNGFSQQVQPHFYGFLERAQLADRLSEAFDAIKNQNPEAAQALLRNIYAWIGQQKQTSEQNGQQQLNPQQDKLAERENQLKQQEEKLFRGEIGKETYDYQQRSVEKSLMPYLKGMKISEQARQRLTNTVHQDVFDNLTQDEGYQRQVRAFLARKDARGTKVYIKAHLDSIIPEISKRAVQDLYGAPTKAAKAASLVAAAPAKPNSNGIVQLMKKPSMTEIEKRPGWMTGYISGKAMMATGPYKGRYVTWKKA